jgi:hypothetical protein
MYVYIHACTYENLNYSAQERMEGSSMKKKISELLSIIVKSIAVDKLPTLDFKIC